MSNKRMWLGGIIDLDLRILGSGTITNSGKLTLGSRVGFGSRVDSKSKNWNSHSSLINGMWLSKCCDSISKSMGTGINVGSKNWSKLGMIPESTYFRRWKLNHKVGDKGYIHIQVQSHWMKNLSICPRFKFGQVQICVMKLNLDQSLQDTKILHSYQYG